MQLHAGATPSQQYVEEIVFRRAPGTDAARSSPLRSQCNSYHACSTLRASLSPVITERIWAACVAGMPVIARALIGLEYDVAPKLVVEAERRRLDVNPHELMVRSILSCNPVHSCAVRSCSGAGTCARACVRVHGLCTCACASVVHRRSEVAI